MPITVEGALAERVSDDGLLVMVDEAHVIEAEAGRTLLAAWQKVARNGPVMLMLAGTPGLEARLRGIGATFGGRKNRITLDGLEPEAAVQAICSPLNDAGIEVPGEIAQRAAEDSRSYPLLRPALGVSKEPHAKASRTLKHVARIVDKVLTGRAPSIQFQVAFRFYHGRSFSLSITRLRFGGSLRRSILPRVTWTP